MTKFIGEFDCKLDAKGRISLPASLRRQIPPDANNRFVINRGFEKCLVLYPQHEWDAIVQRISALNQFKKEVREFIRVFYRGATELELDSASRLNLPPRLLKYADITKEAVLFAHTNKIELWSKQQYNDMMEGESEGFADLAESVMGGQDDIIGS